MVHFGLAVMALCTFLALMVALFSAKKMAVREKLSQRLETANWNPTSLNKFWMMFYVFAALPVWLLGLWLVLR